MQATAEAIAPLCGVPAREAWPAGTEVSYFSTSENQWMPALIVAYNESLSTYDLNIRKQVTMDRLRARKGSSFQSAANISSSTSSSFVPKAPTTNLTPRGVSPIGNPASQSKSCYAATVPTSGGGGEGASLRRQQPPKTATPRVSMKPGDPKSEWMDAPLRDFGFEGVGDFIRGLGASFELPRSVSLDLELPRLELPRSLKKVVSQSGLVPQSHNGLTQNKKDQSAKSQYKKDQRVQVWSQSEGAWMDAVINNVYQDGAVGICYLDKNAHKVIPEEALAQWLRAQPYMSVVHKEVGNTRP